MASRDKALDSIAVILVQEHEVVVASYISDKVQVMAAETDPNPSTDLDELSTDSEESPAPNPQLLFPLQLAAVSNPDYNSSNSGLNENPHNLHIETTGKNLLEKVRDSCKWHCCYVEFVLEHSPSISVCLCLFPTVLRPSILFLPTILSFSVPSYCTRVRIMFPSYPSHPFSFPH